ncbi:MAG: HIT family protein [Methanothrix sp.]
MDCVFCRLAADSRKHIYEDEHCYVVLDINPVTRGHMLVITKKHYENVLNVPKDELSSCFGVAQDFARLVIEKLGAKGVNIGTNIGEYAGQVVMHAHIHVIPRYVHGYSKRHVLGSEEETELLNILKKRSI